MSQRTFVETLEGRQLMHGATVTSVLADNRGEVQVTFNTPVVNVSRNTVVFFTAGPDGEINTNDDVRKRDITIRNRGDGRVTIFGRTDVNALYRIRLLDDISRADDGGALDGEFTGTFPSGDGTEGGNLSFAARRDRGGRPTLRFSTSLGTANVKLFRDTSSVARTVSNFIDYANDARLDGTIIHRNAVKTSDPNSFGIIQGGGFYDSELDSNGDGANKVPTYDPIPLQAGISNTRGTLAMARLGDPNTDSATSQFFFNTADNAVFDVPPQPNGYAVFGEISSSAGFATIDAINGSTNVNKGGVFGEIPQTTGGDIVVRRVALLHKVEAL